MIPYGDDQAAMMAALTILLDEISIAYTKSDARSLHLGYALIAGACRRNAPLLIGFNWGGRVSSRQAIVEPKPLAEEDIGSLRRATEALRSLLGPDCLVNASQSNLCFFRSPQASDISQKDLNLCVPILHRLIAVLEPTVLIGFSAALRDHIADDRLKEPIVTNCETRAFEFERGSRRQACIVMRARHFSGTPVIVAPHPNSPIPKAVRDKAWAFCFDRAAWVA